MPHADRQKSVQLKQKLKDEARRLGFQAVGIARAERLSTEARRLEEWLDAGRHGTMRWMEGHFEKRVDPRVLVPGARTVISVLENYHQSQSRPDSPGSARVSRYALGDDYHFVMKERLAELLAWLDAEVGGVEGRAFVDSAPVMDKAWAARAGLGWIGKHTNLINQKIGSWFFIGELIVDTEIEPDSPVSDLCGSCTRCLDACPTDALYEPYVIDASRCISYLTIEHREDDIQDDLQSMMGNWVFGCDICQEVCPWNKFATPTIRTEYAPRPGMADLDLVSLSRLTESEFKTRFQKSPVMRAKFEGFQRNVRIARSNDEEREAESELNPREEAESEK